MRLAREAFDELFAAVCDAFSTPDLAHAGSWRSYAAQVTRIDLLLMTLHRFVETDLYYQGRTALFVVPDCGRGTQRFDQHAEPFGDEAQRRLFLLAVGRIVPAGSVVEDRREQIDVAPTIAARLGFEIADAEGAPLKELA